MRLRVAHIITGLNTGGAEVMLYRLLSKLDRSVFASQVISLTDIGPVGGQIEALGVPVQALHLRRGVPDPAGILGLARALRTWQPDAIQTWLYHADLMGGMAARLAGGPPVAWGLHMTQFDPASVKRTTRLTIRLCAWLSRTLPARIVCCAESARQVHMQAGYDSSRMMVIPNGVDLEAFRPDPKARAAVRAEFGLPPETPLILMPARFHPQKDHRNFLAAVGRLLSRRPEVVFLLCGDGMDAGNAELRGWIEAAGVGEQVRLLGRRGDVARLSAGADLVTLSSAFGEAFPMVLLEAMACGTPCVATDVGDTACLLGETGSVVPPRNPAALADAWSTVLALPEESRRDWGHKARRRVEEQFDLSAIAERYAQLYREMRGA